ncbi:SusC/RagA family TonB-linked outer membrane protein [Psychroflexus salis]|uniref:SusC/RagA family TonB-linked outer membrane protein n=1 Tax=Psychroflexus salis TaxID=1526574 RepID=UPI001667C45D|nr:TonB-dependent receptor [Psychroflexus salis]
MLKNYLFILCSVISLGVFAQTIEISGTVIDGSSNIPLPDANVSVEGTQNGTSTDFDGNFSLSNVSPSATIVVSYLGFVTQKIPVNGQTKFEIVLQPDTEALDDVVVIGYGKSSRRNITGAVSKVGSESIKKLEPLNAAQSLQGTVSGVNVTPQGGAPGAEANIRIRGVSTNGNNKPLIILDGYQYEGGLNSINPQDIENITVLKDAQAAIYGTLGANGVVLVTTKSGSKNQAAQFEYSTYYGLQETTRSLPLLNATEYGILMNEKYTNAGQVNPLQNINSLGTGTDWQKEVFETAPVVSHNISVRGGSEKTTYRLSASQLEQEGIVGGDKSGFKRQTAQLNLNSDLTDKFNLKTTLSYFRTENRNLNTFGLGSVLFNAINMAPTIGRNVDNLTGEIDLGNEVVNPLTQIRNTYNEGIANRLSGNIHATFEYMKNVDIQARIGFNSANSRYREFLPIFNYGPNKVFNRLDDNLVIQNQQSDYDYTVDIFHTYSNKFNDIHDLTFVVGMNIFKQFGENVNATRTGVPNNSWEFANIGSATGTGDQLNAGSFAYDVRRLSYFGRVQYTLKDKYLFSGMLRRDATTRFGPDNRFGYFPSATAGWIASDEDFFPKVDAIDFLKVRGSFGILGNDRIGDFLYRSLMTGSANYVDPTTGIIQGQSLGPLSNPNVKWEETTMFDIGFDLRLWNNKLNLVVDYFQKDTKDLLIPGIPVTGITGITAPGSSAPTINAGDVRNQGVEFEISYSDNWTEDLSISTSFNISTLTNEVTGINGADFLEGGQFGVGQPAPSRMEVGQPIGYFYGYQTNGIFQTPEEVAAHPSQLALGANAQPGDLRFVDANGDGVIDLNDRKRIGSPIPEFTLGYNLSLKYKQFDFSTYMFANIGNDIVRNFERDQPNVNMMSYNMDRWVGPGTSNEVPRLTSGATANRVFSDFFVEDGSFLRVQTVSVGYNFKPQLLEKIKISNLRLYAKVDNVFTFTNYSGYDPTASTGAPIGGGIDFGFYPLPRTAILGLNAQF